MTELTARWDWWNDIGTLVAWLNDNNELTDHEMAMRLMKLSEEVGEVMQAYIGMVGQNPRKGVTHSVADVALELCDVIVTAAVALASLTGGTTAARGVLASKLAGLVKRAEDGAR